MYIYFFIDTFIYINSYNYIWSWKWFHCCKWNSQGFSTSLPASSSRVISITSYNEWGEGTQIEEARPHTAAGTGVVYADYGPNSTDAYMQLTRRLVDETQAKCAAAKPRPPVLKPEL